MSVMSDLMSHFACLIKGSMGCEFACRYIFARKHPYEHEARVLRPGVKGPALGPLMRFWTFSKD